MLEKSNSINIDSYTSLLDLYTTVTYNCGSWLPVKEREGLFQSLIVTHGYE